TTTTSTTTTSTTTTSTTTSTTTTTTTSTTTTTTTTTAPPETECCVEGSGGNLTGNNSNERISFELGTDDPICNCGGEISGKIKDSYYKSRVGRPPIILLLKITKITDVICQDEGVLVIGRGNEYDGDGDDDFVAERSFSLFLTDDPDTIRIIISRSSESDYDSGVVEVTNGDVIISECP
ncbi:MAG: hypothetical protein ACOCRU_00390, partial [bacterium]